MVLYRAKVINLGNDEDYLKSEIFLEYEEYSIIRMTKFFWIIKVNGKERRVGKYSKAQFASSSKEIALNKAYHRNLRHMSILNMRLKYSKKVNEFLKEESCK